MGSTAVIAGRSQSVLSSVRALAPTIAASAAEVDRLGAVDPRVIGLLQDAGYFSLLQPTSFGGPDDGLDDGLDVYLSATREIASACTSTGWLAAWLAVNSWGLSVRDERVLREIWDSDRRALLCSSYAPTGRLHRVDGGFWLSGRWPRCTGAQHASWLSAAALLVGPDGSAQDFMAVLVPRTDYLIEPTWNGLGLRGIGADDVVVSGAFVPDHRSFSWLDLDHYGPATPLDRLPQPAMYTLAGTLPLLGAAERVLREHRGETMSSPLSPVALATTDIELSVGQIRRNMAELLERVRAGAHPDNTLVLRARRDQVMASERSMHAIGTVVHDPDSGGDPHLLERVWRDAQTARIHVSSNVEQVLAVAGRHTLGLKVDDLIW